MMGRERDSFVHFRSALKFQLQRMKKLTLNFDRYGKLGDQRRLNSLLYEYINCGLGTPR
jgi:hypothetical protein